MTVRVRVDPHSAYQIPSTKYHVRRAYYVLRAACGISDPWDKRPNPLPSCDMEPRCCRCGVLATAAMSFQYDRSQIWMDGLDAPLIPGTAYAMCEDHAGRLTPPVGWTLTDRRGVVRPLALALEVA